MHEKFAELAKVELEAALSKLPSDPLHKFVLFTDATRALDYLSVFQSSYERHGDISKPDYGLILSGWNLAARYLLTPIESPGFPISESTAESRGFAAGLLRKLGQSVLLVRVSQMIRSGFLSVGETEGVFTVKSIQGIQDQFLDNLEFGRLADLEEKLRDEAAESFGGWKLIDRDDYLQFENVPGFFVSRPQNEPLGRFKSDNIDDLMLPLIRPWDSGHGIMMAYGARPEVDAHFLAEATELAVRWRDEAGIHPDAELGSITGADLTAMIALVTALHMKHIRFALIAMKNLPEISIPQSLTIWGPLSELEDSLVDFSPLKRTTVKNTLEAITLRPEEAVSLQSVTIPSIPLLVSLGNGLILRPVSSLVRNPFFATGLLLQSRNPKLRHEISKPREDWMRSEIYAIFQGNRYRRVHGNIRIRDGQRTATDIDAAIYDKVTGELALFQLKWQDYFTNDVRELRSKARNLTEQFDLWAQIVETWIGQKGLKDLAGTLQLKLKKYPISSVYLFGVSRTYARTRGFGYQLASERLAVANWPQFLRTRHEVGPASRVFSELFKSLREQMHRSVKSTPLPFTIQVNNMQIHFEDLWNDYSYDEA